MGIFGPPNIQRMKAKKDIKGLIKALGYRKKKDPYYHALHIRRNAAKALGQIGDPRAVEPLIAALGDNEETAVEALGEIGDSRAIEPLMIVLKRSAVEQGVFQKYIRRKVGTRIVAEALVKLRAVDAFISILKDEQWVFRKVAAVALGEIGDLFAVEPLCESFKDESHPLVRIAVVEALGRMGGPKSIEPLTAGLKDSIWDVQKASAEAFDKLACIPDQKEAAVWYWIAKQDSEQVLAFGTSATDPLSACLNRHNAPSRFAVKMLGEIGDARAVEPLISILHDNSFLLPIIAAHALGQIGDLRAVEPLISVLKRGPDCCVAAVEALCKIGDDRAVEPLIEILIESIYSKEREAAARALGEFGDVRAVEPLIMALQDKERSVRQSAANQLIKMYQSGNLHTQLKERILSQRNIITTAHDDSYDPCMSGLSGHTDHGIGIDFSL